MKISLITQYLEGHGGTERVISELVNHDLVNTYQVLVPASGKPDWLQWFKRPQKTYSVKICHAAKKSQQQNFITENILAFKPDIVLGLEGKANRLANQIRKEFNLAYRIISWSHTTIAESKKFAPKNLSYPDYHLAISTGIKKQLIARNVDPQKVFLIFNPIKLRPTQPITVPQDNIFHPVFIGRILLDGQKNVRMLLEVLKKLTFPWKIDIFGEGKDLPAAKQLASNLGIAANINWCGWVADPWKAIKQADCLLLCSKYEGFPMVVVEAISRGLPVISTDCPTGPRDIINQANGILTPMKDQAAFVAACKKVYQNRRKIDRRQVQTTIKRFDTKTYIKRLQLIYHFAANPTEKYTIQIKNKNEGGNSFSKSPI